MFEFKLIPNEVRCMHGACDKAEKLELFLHENGAEGLGFTSCLKL
jgi:hypothetical protein